MSENDFECFARTGVNTQGTVFPNRAYIRSGTLNYSLVPGSERNAAMRLQGSLTREE